MFVGISPMRISFAGGGTDMPEYYEKFGGCVVSTTIDLFTNLIFNPRAGNSIQAFASDFESHQKSKKFEDLEIQLGTEIAVSAVKLLNFKMGGDYLISSNVKPGSGLGGSSSLAVNCVKTISTLQNKNLSNKEIAETAFYIEREILKHPIGKQDDYIASFGGFNFIRFNSEQIDVTPIDLSPSTLLELQENLMLFNTGTTRKSSDVLKSQQVSTKNQNNDTLNSLHTVKELAEDLYQSLKASDLQNFAEIMNKGWNAKKKFTKGVTNERIDKIYESAISSGAIGGKITGAGGGGHILLYCEKNKQQFVKEKMENMDLNFVKFKFYRNGAKVLNLYDYI
ncbi:MAG: D-glycero-D-manno-heptose 7-phosphate kinase [Thaumarchaeota archaeon]|jgi:D-glycero-alpha-D-manno-heptose-7-phosphate kinase|nr:MAG: D-glycero-D-manno-heptose 7-phosphate kinase [Nitrososphaerota archaeon]